MSELQQIFPGTLLGDSGESITDCAFDLGKRHLATVSIQGIIKVFKRTERQDEWVEECRWKQDERASLTKVKSCL